MCGISGFSGIPYSIRKKMVTVLGMGIDQRGGDAAGYVSILNGRPIVRRKVGHWLSAKDSFIYGASVGETCMMHARWRTSGADGILGAHPFEIQREGFKIWGAHNGVISNAYESAAANNRVVAVDSEEIFHLIADEDFASLHALEGYGVIEWIDSRHPDRVHLARLSDYSDLSVAMLKGGGIVWGSTDEIVKDACKYAGARIAYMIDMSETGRVYVVSPRGAWLTEEDHMHISTRKPRYRYITDEDWSEYLEKEYDEFDVESYFNRAMEKEP